MVLDIRTILPIPNIFRPQDNSPVHIPDYLLAPPDTPSHYLRVVGYYIREIDAVFPSPYHYHMFSNMDTNSTTDSKPHQRDTGDLRKTSQL